MALETALKKPAATLGSDVAPVARVSPDSWLVGAFLVLVGVALAAAAPQILEAVRVSVANAASAGEASTKAAQRPTIRVSVVAVRWLEPKAGGGLDAVLAPVSRPTAKFLSDTIFSRPVDVRARVQERGFSARAPPSRGA